MVIEMLRKEFTLILRDKQSLAALFIMPFCFILIMSMALKDTLCSDRPLLNYTIIDHDDSRESKRLQDLMVHMSFLKKVDADYSGTTHLTITIPQGFAGNILKTQKDQPLLELTIAPDVKQEMAMMFQAKLSADIMTLRLMQIQEEIAPFFPDAQLFPNAENLHKEQLLHVDYMGMQKSEQPSATQQSVPSWIVFGMFFIIIPMSTIFIGERKQNTLMRMASMNISIPALFAGKVIPYILINQLQVVLMVSCGVFVVPLLGGDALTPGHSLFGLGLVSLALSVAAIGTSMLIATLASTVEQATTIGGLLNILLGPIGGIMVPKMYMPHSMQTFANVSPMSWGLEGFLDIFLRGYGVVEIIPEVTALSCFGISLLLLAAFIFNRRTVVE